MCIIGEKAREKYSYTSFGINSYIEIIILLKYLKNLGRCRYTDLKVMLYY